MTTNIENPYAGQGPVLLDIGGDIGALVVQMPAAMDGVEVELRPAGATARQASVALATREHASHNHNHDHDGPDHDGPDHVHHDHHQHTREGDEDRVHYPHVAVVGRPAGDVLRHSLVYPDVVQGDYELFPLPDGPVALTVSVHGGAVATASWPDDGVS